MLSRLLVPCIAFLAASAAAQAQQFSLEALTFEPVASGVDQPTAIAHAGDGSGRLFVAERRGRISIIENGALLGQPFLDIQDRVQDSAGEMGLLGLAFHPSFAENGLFFVNYTNFDNRTVIARFEVDDAGQADPASETVLLTILQPFRNHNAGQLQFGPDGYLYIATGDGGSGGDPGGRGQSLGTLLGKILRIDVDSGTPFAVPDTNPFLDDPNARDEIWASGLRNPWRFSFDRQTGDMYIGDVGQNRVEEINFEPGGNEGGSNYGWRRMEGSLCFNPASNCNDGSLTLPILEYAHVGEGCSGSVTGGYVYRGLEYPHLDGIYFYADFCTGAFYAGVRAEESWSQVGPRATSFSIGTFGEDEAGEMYFGNFGDATIYRLQTNPPAPALSSIQPSESLVGGPSFTLVVSGSLFTPDSRVSWAGEMRPTTFVDSTRLEVSISMADIAQIGVFQVRVVTPGGGTSLSVPFSVEAPGFFDPTFNDGGVVSAADFDLGAGLAPGSIASAFGFDLSVNTVAAEGAPLPTILGGSTMLFNGQTAVPKFFASPVQVNFQIPWELEGSPTAGLTAAVANEVSERFNLPLARVSPAVFTVPSGGNGQAAALISGVGVLAAPEGFVPGSRPARIGEALEIFVTGLGPVSNPPASGAPALASPLSATIEDVSVRIGVEPARVLFSGLAPGFVGLYQINVELVGDFPVGPAVPLTIFVAGVESNTVTIAIE